jgi:hypothetical protein
MAPGGIEGAGVPEKPHQDADASHAVLAAVAQIGLALHESHPPVTEMGSLLARVSDTLRALQKPASAGGALLPDDVSSSIGQLQIELHKAVEQLQFYDRLAQHLSRLQDYLIDVANQLADPAKSGTAASQVWAELRAKLRNHLITDEQRVLLDLFISLRSGRPAPRPDLSEQSSQGSSELF